MSGVMVVFSRGPGGRHRLALPFDVQPSQRIVTGLQLVRAGAFAGELSALAPAEAHPEQELPQPLAAQLPPGPLARLEVQSQQGPCSGPALQALAAGVLAFLQSPAGRGAPSHTVPLV